MSGDTQVWRWTPLVTEPMGTSAAGSPDQRPLHIFRLTSPWSALTPFAAVDRRSASTAMLKPVLPGNSRPRARSCSWPRESSPA